MADNDRKLSWRAINLGSISSILCFDNRGRGLEGVSWGSRNMGARKLCNLEKWIWAGNYKQLQLVLAILAPIKKWTKTGATGKQSLAILERTSEAQKQVWLIVFFSAVRVRFIWQTNILELLEFTNGNDCPRILWALQGLIPALSALCQGGHAACQNVIVSVQWRGWGHRLLVGPRSLKSPQRTGH